MGSAKAGQLPGGESAWPWPNPLSLWESLCPCRDGLPKGDGSRPKVTQLRRCQSWNSDLSLTPKATLLPYTLSSYYLY